METNKLKLLVSKSCLDFGRRVDKHLQLIRESEGLIVPVNARGEKTFIAPMDEPIFSNGESKVVLLESVRGCDVYYLTDVNNWGLTYPLHGLENNMSPQDHFRNITSAVGAVRGDAARLTVIQTILYESRQHRRKSRESLNGNLLNSDVSSGNFTSGNSLKGILFSQSSINSTYLETSAP